MKTSSAVFNLGQAFGEAVALHRQGQLREAERIYARVLKAAPDHFDALNLLGAVKIQQGQFGEAQRLFAGRQRHRLRRHGDTFRIVEKRVDLINCDGAFEAMAVPI